MSFLGIKYSIKVFTRDLSWKIPLKYLRTYKDNLLKFFMLLVKKSKFMIYVKKAKIRALLRADIQKVRSLKIPEFWAPPPSSFALIHFRAPPPPPSRPPKVRSFRLELTLSPSISTLVKFREMKLIMSTSSLGWTQRVF